MEQTMQMRQELSGFWYAYPENDGEVCADTFSEEKCERMELPALISKMHKTPREPVWFYHPFSLRLKKEEHRRIFLRLSRADYYCEVWLNGQHLGTQQHAEKPFVLDLTDALRKGENLLACRVFSPLPDGSAGFEGIALRNVPNAGRVFQYYTALNSGGVYGPVYLESRPEVILDDLHVIPDCETGEVTVELTLKNGVCRSVSASASVAVTDGGIPVNRKIIALSVPENGTAIGKLTLQIPGFRFWSPDSPVLYGLHVTLSASGETEERELRFGFRSLCVKNGFFYLNGKRIFLTCAHVGAGLTKEKIAEAKAMGFLALRFLCALAPEELLDYCDEAGMLVYEECAVSWGMSDYPGMPEHMKAYLENMLYRDRNHVSVGLYGIFNEQPGRNEQFRSGIIPDTREVFDYAVSCLPDLRKLDDTRLILLSSGRWDGRADIGSLSNPGSDRWEYEWGGEGADASPNARRAGGDDVPPYVDRMGDNHLYPTVPIQNSVRDFVRTLGADTNPVFLSEYGVGYQLALEELYEEQKVLGQEDAPFLRYYGVQLRMLSEWVKKYGLENLYPSPDDFLLASVAAGAEQRRESIDPIRANPQICGYNFTSFSTGNEGVYFCENRMIPGITDALRDSFAPLRWCVFTDRTELYENEPFPVEIVLANADTLPAGTYRASVSVRGDDGVVFRENAAFSYPAGDPAPLAASVFRCTIPGLPAGNYTFSVRRGDGFQPLCGEKRFRVYPEITEKLSVSVCLYGETSGLPAFLEKIGVRCVTEPDSADLLLAGKLPDAEERAALLNLAWSGKRVCILDPGFWEGSNTSDQRFMGKIEYNPEETSAVFGTCVYVRNWLYHMDNYIADPALFKGIAKPGLLDMAQFRELYPERYLINTGIPKKTGCAAFGSGLFAENGCIAALTMGTFAFGKGTVFVSTFRLLENCGMHPAADRLLFNLIKILTTEEKTK